MFSGPYHNHQETLSPTYFSSAPADRITSAYVFETGGSHLCQGILLNYDNGGQRALGQCRLGIDQSKEYIRPIGICFRRVLCLTDDWRRKVHGIQVEFTSLCCSHSTANTWQCQPLSGASELRFWFSELISTMDVVTR